MRYTETRECPECEEEDSLTVKVDIDWRGEAFDSECSACGYENTDVSLN